MSLFRIADDPGSQRPRWRFALIALFFILLLNSLSGATDDEASKAVRRGSPEVNTTADIGAGDLYALVVGVSRYRNPKIPQLRVSDKDARDFADFLKTQDKLFKSVHVDVLENEKATKQEVEKHLYYKLRRAGKDDTVVLFFSGHGADDPNTPGEFVFLTYDADPEYLTVTAVQMSRQWFLQKLESRKVLLIADACHAGGFSGQGAKSAQLSFQSVVQQFKESEGRVFLTSSRPDELSREKPEEGNSIFTHYLLKGLKGAAAGKDGVVTLKDLYDYVYANTKDETSGFQRPQMDGRMVGRFPLALARLHGTQEPEPRRQDTPPASESPQDEFRSLVDKAERGDENSQFKLGLIYEFGLRGPRDTQEALKWYGRAASQGNKEAKQAVERLTRAAAAAPVAPTVVREIDWAAKLDAADMKKLERFSQVVNLTAKNYVREIRKDKAYDAAVEGLLKQLKEPIPEDFQTNLSKKLEAEKNELKRFGLALKVIGNNFIVNDQFEDVVGKAITGFLKSLDPHSSFLTKDQYKELQVETKGEFGGVGVEITLEGGALTVVSPIDGSPASRAGLRTGDKITKISGTSTKDITLLEAVKQMRGPKGSAVALTIDRNNEILDFVLTREIIRVQAVKKELLEKGYPYIRIVNFQENLAGNLQTAIKDLGGDSGIRGLIIDLRNNPGGLLDQAVKTANLFVDKGMIVYTDGRLKEQKQEFRAVNTGSSYKFRIAVLVNKGSASASEIVAGALQDHDRCLVFGTRTFGKATVQTIFPVEAGCAVRLTSAYYHTPNGRILQDNGIQPDVDLTEDMEKDSTQGKALRRVEGERAVKIEPGDDPVVKKALEWLKSDSTVKQFKMQKKKPLASSLKRRIHGARLSSAHM